jgi:hypothetical protein
VARLNTIDYVDQIKPKAGDSVALWTVSSAENEASLTEAMRADLAQGYWVLAPRDVAQPLAHWRVHPETGETLGMLIDGRGSEMIEYLAQLVGISMTMVNALSALAECEAAGGNLAERACCIMNAHAGTVMDQSYGNVLGAMFGNAGALMIGVVQAQVNEATNAPGLSLMDCGDMQNYGDF